MSKSIRFQGPCGVRASGAIRRIGKLAGRTRREWTEHKALQNHAWAGHVATREARPRLILGTRIDLQTIALSDFLDSVPEVTTESVEIPVRARFVVEDVLLEAVEALR